MSVDQYSLQNERQKDSQSCSIFDYIVRRIMNENNIENKIIQDRGNIQNNEEKK